MHPDANRELLLKLCVAAGLCVANTFLESDPEHQITYHDLWASPVADDSYKKIAQLDLVLISPGDMWQVTQVRSDTWQALASHHFLLEVVVDVRMRGDDKNDALVARPKISRYDFCSLNDNMIKNQFADRFQELANGTITKQDDPEELTQAICKCFETAAFDKLPRIEAQPLRPWIQNRTLALIVKKDDDRKAKDRKSEVASNKEIRKSARRDRTD